MKTFKLFERLQVQRLGVIFTFFNVPKPEFDWFGISEFDARKIFPAYESQNSCLFFPVSDVRRFPQCEIDHALHLRRQHGASA